MGLFTRRRVDPMRLTAEERVRVEAAHVGAIVPAVGVRTRNERVVGIEGAPNRCPDDASLAPLPAKFFTAGEEVSLEGRPWAGSLTGSARLVCYRTVSDPAGMGEIASGVGQWLATALAKHGSAYMGVEVVGGEVRLVYEEARLLEPLIPEARFGPLPAVVRCRFPARAVVVGEPAEEAELWDALLAPGVLGADVRLTVMVQGLPGGEGAWLREASACLAAEAARLERFDRTLTVGDSSTRIPDSDAAARRVVLEEARRRLLGGGAHAAFAVVIEAQLSEDLDTACAVLLASCVRSDANGLASDARRLDADAGGVLPAVPVVPVPLTRAARAMLPPRRALRGLTVIDDDPSAAAAAPLASGGFSRSGEVYVGRLGTGAAWALPLKSFCRHLVVTGTTGMGKSHLTGSIVRQLIAAGVPAAVLEPTSKTEYAHLVGDMPGVEVMGDAPGVVPFEENPFQVDQGVRPRVWAQDLTDCMVSAYGLAEQPLPLHTRALIERLYRHAGVDLSAAAPGHVPWPAAEDLVSEIPAYLAEETCAGAEVTANVQGALTLRATAIAANRSLSARRGLCAREVLCPGGHVLQLGDLGGADGAFAAMLIIARLRRVAYAGPPPPRDRPRAVVVVEEAHALFRDARGEFTPFARLFVSAMAELRAAGIGFVVVEQRPSLLPTDVFAHAVTQVHFASRQADDREAVERALGLSGVQGRAMGRMGVGEAVMVGDGFPVPELVRMGG